MKNKSILFLCAFLFLFSSELYSQDKYGNIINPSLRNYGLTVKSWNENNGLPGDRITDLVKDRKGFLWLATNQGLARFDGSGFKIFNEENTPGLKEGLYTHLCLDEEGNMFFLGEQGIIRKDLNDNFSKVVRKSAGAGLLTDIVFDNAGRLWVSSVNNGLYYLSGDSLVLTPSSAGLSAENISVLYKDKNDQIWIASADGGIYKYYKDNFKLIISPLELPRGQIRSLLLDSSGRLWVGTNSGAVYYDTKTGSARTPKFITPEIIKTFSEDSDHNIWMGSFKDGIFIYGKDGIHRFTVENGLSDNNITNITVIGKDIWVGTIKGGINLLRKVNIFSVGRKEGLAENYTNSVFEDEDGSVLLGTAAGIYKIKNPLSDAKAVKLNSLRNMSVFAMKRDHSENLIVGTRYNGLYIISGNIIKNYNSENGLNSNFVRCLYIGKENDVWAGTNGGGISIFKSGKIKHLSKKQGLSSDLISFIHESSDGKIWIGTSGGGVNIINGDGGIKVLNTAAGLSGNVISSIYEDPGGNVWLTVNGGGVSLIRGERIYNFTKNDGLFSNTILNIVRDKIGNFWFSTPRGIFSVNTKSFSDYIEGKIQKLAYRHYDESDGMISGRCVGASPQTTAITRDGIVMFSTVNGLAEIEPSVLKFSAKDISLYFNDVLVNSKPVKPGDFKTLEPHPERIEFSFGAVDFINPSKIVFRCRLEGIDKNWIELGKNKSVGYSHLPFGNYTFRLTAYDPGNNNVLASTGLPFYIKPYFWETAAFRIPASIILLVFLVLLVRFLNKRKYERKIKILEAEKALEKERMRISTDMHDELGASLSKISLLSEIAKNSFADKTKIEKIISDISESSRALAEGMDEIVWAVNPGNDRLDKMLYYISGYFQEHFSLTEINFKVNIPEEIPSTTVSAEIRHNIFSVIKEGINNSLKHSGASEISLDFEYSGKILFIKMKDNGCGIDFTKITEFSNGIGNMRKRIDSIDGEIDIRENEDGGTAVNIKITV